MYLYTPASPGDEATDSLSMKGGDLPVLEHFLHHTSTNDQMLEKSVPSLHPHLSTVTSTGSVARQQQQPLICSGEHTQTSFPPQEGPREEIFGGACLLLQAISNTSQEAALTHFSSCWMKAEMLGRFLFKLLTYLHLLPYNISAKKICLGEAAQMEDLKAGLRAASIRSQF